METSARRGLARGREWRRGDRRKVGSPARTARKTKQPRSSNLHSKQPHHPQLQVFATTYRRWCAPLLRKL